MSEEKEKYVIGETIYRFNNVNHYNEALACMPKPEYIQTRDLGGGKSSRFLGIECQQAYSEVVHLETDVISETYTVVANEILCTVKLCYLPSYPNAQHRFATGTGAKAIQMGSGGDPALFPQKKKINALEYCAAAARSAAISNAFSTMGNLFGRNLNRKAPDNLSFNK